MVWVRGLKVSIAICGALSATAVRAGDPAPFAGCYERVYDAAHLQAHRGQIVRHVKLMIGPTSVPKTPGDERPIVADANLQIWVVGNKRSFGTLGACSMESEALTCNASLSAEETTLCKTKEDGVRDCRLSMDDAGSFEIAPKGDGLLVTVRERLELLGPPEGRSFLYLSPNNAENHAFLLRPAPEGACR
ncbi:hypothetical protein [Methylocystis sp. ATCC 49242]|uniref:hypothetical protein n=1 Tax=Methylocystis sp. ATCC 49242 TaxID=622637 RepID=UPI0001F8780F|nr:hypothetical protein [Methylocystis sp. ATCC 49242]